MSLGQAYLETAEPAVALLAAEQVAAGWEKPAALPGMTVGGLAGHLAYQVLSVCPVLHEPASREEPVPLLEHYARAEWIGAPLDGEVNTGIREKGAEIAAEGPRALLGRVRAAVDELRGGLPALSGERAVFLPQKGWALRLDDFLLTRMMELAVHTDDLAVSVHVETPEVPEASFEPVLGLLARLAAGRHGQPALLRALARAERAPAAVNAL